MVIKSKYPLVSIIIPLFNDERNIAKLLTSILLLDYPKECIEVIVVDNMSTDQSRSIAAKFNVLLVKETAIKSSYAARNLGVDIAKGDILAFTDSDCIVSPNWLKNAVSAIDNFKCDLIGGKITFIFSNPNSPAEIYDSITFMQNDIYVKDRNASATANLIVKAEWFKKIGLFPIVRSGGDSLWTSKAVQNGAFIKYSPDAVVYHPTRKSYQLIKKCFRVGKGAIKKKIEENYTLLEISFIIFRHFVPSRFRTITLRIEERGLSYMKRKIMQIWIVSYFCRIFVGIGFICGLIDLKNKNETTI